MEENMRFGLFLGRLAIQKKNWGPINEKLLRPLFSMFSGAKITVKNLLKVL